MSEYSQMQYTFKEGEAEKPAKERQIEKRGHVINFDWNKIEEVDQYNKNAKEEVEAKRKVELAKMDNIERNHPFVKELSEQDLGTLYMYAQAKGEVLVCDEKLEQFNKAIEDLAKEKEVILTQLPELNESTEKTTDKGESEPKS